MIIGPTVATWYQNELVLSQVLIDRFVSIVESQANECIHQYHREKKTRVCEYTHNGETFEDLIEEHQGVSSDLWNVKSIFEEHFPSLHRRSAFLTVYGYFEHELNELCLLYKSEKHLVLDLSDVYGNGIARSTKYLEKMAGLCVHQGSKEWLEIEKIRQLRNKIAHQDGRLESKQGKPAGELIKYVDESPYLKNDYQVVVLKEGFLKHVVDLFNAYFRLISESIKAKEGSNSTVR